MRMLALEFSSSRRSAALVEEGRVLSRAGEESAPVTGPVALMTDVLHQAGLDRRAVDCVVVGLGPGSYTGIRVSIAIAQGLELGLGVKLLGVSSVDVLVWRAWLEGHHGDIAVLVDAQRGEFYAARYAVTQLGVESRRSLDILPRPEIERWVQEGARLLGPDLDQADLPIRPLFPEAGLAGVLATGSNAFVSGHELTPIYLRQPRFAKAPPPRVIPSRDRPPTAGDPTQPGPAPGQRPRAASSDCS